MALEGWATVNHQELREVWWWRHTVSQNGVHDAVGLKLLSTNDNGAIIEKGLPHVVIVKLFDRFWVANWEYGQLVKNHKVEDIEEKALLQLIESDFITATVERDFFLGRLKLKYALELCKVFIEFAQAVHH